MKWADTLARLPLAKMTNRDAAGLIAFARAAFNRYRLKYGLTPFDWYAFALPALAWIKPGDKFKTDAAWQAKPYAARDLLVHALNTFAAELDSQGQAFEMVTNPVGTDAKFKQLASDAWNVMKQETTPGANRDHDIAAQLDALLRPPVQVAPGVTAPAGSDVPTESDPWEITPGKRPDAAPSTKKTSGGLGWLLLLAIAAYALDEKGSRRAR